MPEPPALSPQQRAAALAKAAEARRARAEIREALRSGSLTLAEVLDRTDEEHIGGMKVKAALTAVPGLGKIKSFRLMDQLGIAENRRLRGLGTRQRRELLDQLS
jgi:hypothetical protein